MSYIVYQLNIECRSAYYPLHNLFVWDNDDEVDYVEKHVGLYFDNVGIRKEDIEMDNGTHIFDRHEVSKDVYDFIKYNPIGLGTQIMEDAIDNMCKGDSPMYYSDDSVGIKLLRTQFTDEEIAVFQKKYDKWNNGEESSEEQSDSEEASEEQSDSEEASEEQSDSEEASEEQSDNDSLEPPVKRKK